MKSVNKVMFPTILYSVIIVIVSWSFIEGWFPIARRQWIFLGLGIVASFFTSQYFFRGKSFFILIAYFLVLWFNSLTGDKYFPDLNAVLVEVFALAFPAATFSYYYCNKNMPDVRFLLTSFFLVLVVTSIASFFIDRFLIPNAIRNMVGLYLLEGRNAVYSYYRLGLSSYTFPACLPILVPPLVMGMKKKNNRKVKIICFILLLPLLLLVFLSGNMTALLLALLSLLLSYFTRDASVRNNIRRLVFIFILFLPLFNQTFMGNVAHVALSVTGEESDYYEKFEAMESEGAGGADWEVRQNLYGRSFSSFTQNILVGTNSSVGNHSSFIDRLGLLGLIGFIPFVWFIFLQLKKGSSLISPNSRMYYWEGCLAGIMMLSIKSSFSPVFFIVLFIILPLITYFISGKENR